MDKDQVRKSRKNISGQNIKRLREALPHKPSQRVFSEILQREGLDVDKNVIQKIEAGTRPVKDTELQMLTKVFGVTYEELMEE